MDDDPDREQGLTTLRPANFTGVREPVASSASPLATEAAMAMLAKGGNAFDGAVAAALVLFATLPMSCGIGGDFAMIGFDATSALPFGLCALGAAPSSASLSMFASLGLTAIPRRGMLSATVPAALPAIETLISERCRLDRHTLFASAIRAAERQIVDERFAKWTRNNIDVVRSSPELSLLYLKDHKPLEPGSTLQQQALASTFTRLAGDENYSTSTDFFASLLNTSNRHHGLFSIEDFRGVIVDRELINIELFDHRVFSTPLPTQGHALLRSLELYRTINPEDRISEAERIHLLCEIFNLAYEERLRFSGDPRYIDCMQQLTQPAPALACHVNKRTRSPCRYRNWYNEGDTTQFAIADRWGNAVTAIASLSLGFGSGVTDPATGVIFNNRLGRSATLKSTDANCVMPGKRPVNTLQVFLASCANGDVLLGGTPGGDGQVQWNADLLSRTLLHGQPVSQAVRHPRFTYFPGAEQAEVDGPAELQLENASAAFVEELASRGHQVRSKRRVQGCLRVVQLGANNSMALDDGHEEGLTTNGNADDVHTGDIV